MMVCLTHAAALLAPLLILGNALPGAIAEPGLSGMPDSDVFPIPNGLEPRIGFWTLVFDTYDSNHALIHDREYPEIVWDVVTLPTHPDYREERRQRRDLVDARLDELRKRLKRLDSGQEPGDELDKRLLNIAASHQDKLDGAWARLRSQTGAAEKFRAGLARAKELLPTVHEALEAHGVPLRLAALPFIESMYTPQVRSHAGAAGLWQLMPATARGLGLQVSKSMDERLDPIKATKAAARMLRDNYRMLGSWPLAITGYNHGPYGVKRGVAAVGSTDLMRLIRRYEKSTWGFASKNFYAEFIAASRIFEERLAEASVQGETSPVPEAGH